MRLESVTSADRCWRSRRAAVFLAVATGIFAARPASGRPALAGTPARSQQSPDARAAADRALAALRERLARRTVLVRGPEMTGSGVILSADGLVLTAAHVAGAEERLCLVTLTDGTIHAGQVESVDRERDTATLRLAGAAGLPAAEPARRTPAAGEWLVAAGYPGERQAGYPLAGLAALQRVVQALPPPARMPPLPGRIVTDAALEPGDSGGPLFDLEGRLVAVHVMAARGGGRRYGVHALVVDDGRRTTDDGRRTMDRERVTCHSPEGPESPPGSGERDPRAWFPPDGDGIP